MPLPFRNRVILRNIHVKITRRKPPSHLIPLVTSRKFEHRAVDPKVKQKRKVTFIHDPCPFCKGYGMVRCVVCGGLTRIYEGEKEYRCDDCSNGLTVCKFCDGSGKCHMVF